MIIKNDKKICGCLIVIAYTEHADRISELWYGLIHEMTGGGAREISPSFGLIMTIFGHI